MFGMSMAEIAVILILALVVLGPEKLPDLARTLGKSLREVRKAGNQIRDALMFEDELNNYRSNNRSGAKANTSPALGYVPPEYGGHDLDDFDGPLDQIDEDDWGLNHSLEHDPHDYHHQHRPSFDVEMKPRGEVALFSTREVELSTTAFAPPAQPDYEARSMANPFDMPHVDIREVHLHEQTRGEW